MTHRSTISFCSSSLREAATPFMPTFTIWMSLESNSSFLPQFLDPARKSKKAARNPRYVFRDGALYLKVKIKGDNQYNVSIRQIYNT